MYFALIEIMMEEDQNDHKKQFYIDLKKGVHDDIIMAACGFELDTTPRSARAKAKMVFTQTLPFEKNKGKVDFEAVWVQLREYVRAKKIYFTCFPSLAPALVEVVEEEEKDLSSETQLEVLACTYILIILSQLGWTNCINV
jgi:hypothetical protein